MSQLLTADQIFQWYMILVLTESNISCQSIIMSSFVSNIQHAAQADLVRTAGAAAVLGVLFHWSIINIEFEQLM